MRRQSHIIESGNLASEARQLKDIPAVFILPATLHRPPVGRESNLLPHFGRQNAILSLVVCPEVEGKAPSSRWLEASLPKEYGTFLGRWSLNRRGAEGIFFHRTWDMARALSPERQSLFFFIFLYSWRRENTSFLRVYVPAPIPLLNLR